MSLESILDIVGEVSEAEGLRMGNEMYRALNSPLEENQLREALWRIMAALKQRNIRYPAIFLRRAKEIAEGRWHPKPPTIPMRRSCEAPRGTPKPGVIERDRERERKRA